MLKKLFKYFLLYLAIVYFAVRAKVLPQDVDRPHTTEQFIIHHWYTIYNAINAMILVTGIAWKNPSKKSIGDRFIMVWRILWVALRMVLDSFTEIFSETTG